MMAVLKGHLWEGTVELLRGGEIGVALAEGEQEGFAVDKQLQNNSLLVAVSSRKKKSLDTMNQEH